MKVIEMIVEGFVHKFGDNIDTDVIMPGRYCHFTKSEDLRNYCFFDYRKDFVKKVKQNDVIVAGDNFGCGSSREVAPRGIQAGGIACVIAKSFARLFYRNAINIGLPLIENRYVYDLAQENTHITIDFSNENIVVDGEKVVTFRTKGENQIVNDILEKKGLIQYIRDKKFLI